MSAVSLDLEVVELLRDRPELLAIADAISATQAERRDPARRGTVRWIGLVAAVAAGVVLALAAPWPGGEPGFAAKALAALGEGPVIHVVSTFRVPGASIVDLRSGATSPIEYRTEVLYDGNRRLERIRSIVGGALVSDVVETPQGSWSATGPVYTCAWIAAHPLQATRARVSCNIRGSNGTTPRKLPEPVPTLDPALAGFVTGYKAALKEKRAIRIGRGVVAGRRVQWLRFAFVERGPAGTRPGLRVERVAVDASTLKPVRIETTIDGRTEATTISAVETVAAQPQQFARPTLLPAKQRPAATSVTRQRRVSIAKARAVVGGRLVWAGRSIRGLTLSSVEAQSIVTGYGPFSRVRPTHAAGVELVYGSTSDAAKRVPYVRLQEAAQPLMLYGFLNGRSAPREGAMRVETFTGQTFRQQQVVVRRWTTWRAILVKDGRYIQLEATSRPLLLAAARALETR